jgi:hypothetical protein
MRRLHGGFLAVGLLLIVCQGQLLAQRTSRSYEGAYRTFYGSGYDSRYGLGHYGYRSTYYASPYDTTGGYIPHPYRANYRANYAAYGAAARYERRDPWFRR